MDTLTICIATDFSLTPGPRHRNEGKFSGEKFLEEHLRPKFLEARRKEMSLLIDLDGTAGYATSFLESAFGGLARSFGAESVQATLQLKSEEEPDLKDEIWEYIRSASEG